MSRQVVLDTETTGIGIEQDHRIIEIGCVELLDRKLTGEHFHVYINPKREVDPDAVEIHGLDNAFLADKPVFSAIAADFLMFIKGAELIIHNAPFDVGFINHEFAKLTHYPRVDECCGVVDTLVMARKKHPGQRNSLDALCKRYLVDNSHRQRHGALLDAEILADVYLAMTGGQTALELSVAEDVRPSASTLRYGQALDLRHIQLPLIQPSTDEIKKHRQCLERMEKQAGKHFWS